MTNATFEPTEPTPSQLAFMEIDRKIRSNLTARVDQLIEEQRSEFAEALAAAKLPDQSL
ncbi:MAG: hypothetical protein AAF636_27785 [Pseudomonadota bacterium]